MLWSYRREEGGSLFGQGPLHELWRLEVMLYPKPVAGTLLSATALNICCFTVVISFEVKGFVPAMSEARNETASGGGDFS